jgi:Protein of unknown function DUF262
MSYSGISVRDALDKLNSPNNGWYLPQVQRQYVWGTRHESETYICLLLDSLLRRYPIGGIVLWETQQEIPYRRFIGDYAPGKYAYQVDQGLWGAPKALVYDGQQRLQTLYSVLRHRFNGRVLHFDLLFNSTTGDETGFLFRDSGAVSEARYLRMTEISCRSPTQREKVAVETKALVAAGSDQNIQILIRENVSALWDIFVDSNVKSIAYFCVKSESSDEVNEIFRRLNTGGIALTQLELILGKIKAVHSDYEERLWSLSEEITNKSGGIQFLSPSILQYFHLLIKKTVQIDQNRLEMDEIPLFEDVLQEDTAPFVEVFKAYLKELLNINHSSILPRWLAVLPIPAYLTERRRSGHKWRIRELPADQLRLIHQYFLLSQLCDWNTQTMVNAFAREAMSAGRNGEPFPLEVIRKIAVGKNRTGTLQEYQLLAQPWFATKVLMPSRSYVFHESKPQVDHIFPLRLAEGDDVYQKSVDVLWNFQPMPAEVNNFKRARHPNEFFSSNNGSKYWSSYDFIPPAGDVLWNDHLAFIDYRKARMLNALESLYGLSLNPTPV